jgi:hypothetical protein
VKWRKMLELDDIKCNKNSIKACFFRSAGCHLSFEEKKTLQGLKNETTLKKEQEFLSQQENHGRRKILLQL